jgi:hypothetical protein
VARRQALTLAGIALGALAVVPVCAFAATTYPVSNGSDGCDFSVGGTYSWNTDTGTMITPGGSVPVGTVEGTLRVLHCATLTIPAGVTFGISGSHAPDLRATGAIQIDGTIDVSASGQFGGTGRLNSSGADQGLAGGRANGAIRASGGNPGMGGFGGASGLCCTNPAGGGGGGGGPAGGGGGFGG